MRQWNDLSPTLVVVAAVVESWVCCDAVSDRQCLETMPMAIKSQRWMIHDDNTVLPSFRISLAASVPPEETTTAAVGEAVVHICVELEDQSRERNGVGKRKMTSTSRIGWRKYGRFPLIFLLSHAVQGCRGSSESFS